MTEHSFGAYMADHSQQQLLVDTDAYCKLGVAGLFTDAVNVLGVQIEECGRLAALPYMLRRGSLRRRLGHDASDALARFAETVPLAIQPSPCWLDPLITAHAIDPGEAQLLAASAEHRLLVLTGDKRGLRGVKDVPGYAEPLDGQVVVLEAVLAELCSQLGEDTLRARINPLVDIDIVVRICFSDSTVSPIASLRSYYEEIASQVKPLNLWKPLSMGGK